MPRTRSDRDETESGDDRLSQIIGSNQLSPDQIFELEKLRLGSTIEQEKLRLEATRNEIRLAEIQLERERIQSHTSFSREEGGFSHDREEDRKTALVRNSLPKLNFDREHVAQEFLLIENTLDYYEVQETHRARILISLIGGKVKNLFTICDQEMLKNYSDIKRAVLQEFKLTAGEYREKFLRAKRSGNMTYAQYGNELVGLLNLYLESREAETFDQLKKLLVSDRFKDELHPSVQNHIALAEGDRWKEITELVQIAQRFDDAMGVNKGGKSKNKEGQAWVSDRIRNPTGESRAESFNRTTGVSRDAHRTTHYTEGGSQSINRPATHRLEGIKCFYCGNTGHYKTSCKKWLADQQKTAENRRVNRVAESRERVETEGVVARVAINKNRNIWRGNKQAQLNEDRSSLSYVDIFLEDGSCVKGTIDSGSEVAIFRKDMVENNSFEVIGQIVLIDAFGHRNKADLINIKLSARKAEIDPQIFTVAVTPELMERALIPPEFLDKLRKSDSEETLLSQVTLGAYQTAVEGGEGTTDVAMSEDNEDSGEHTTVERGEENELVGGSPDRETTESNPRLGENLAIGEAIDNRAEVVCFKNEQQKCQTLTEAWGQARKSENGFYISEGILMHKEKLTGELIFQLVVPEGRRKLILEKAHEEEVGSHMAESKTLERIKRAFYWPKMKAMVRAFCQSCEACQKRRVVITKDRTPIKAIVRNSVPFEIWQVDVIGSLDPVSSRGHKYILTVVDLCSRWPEAVPLKDLSARSSCNALLQIFVRTGLPKIVCSDGGSNFTSKITKRFHELLGVSPRWAANPSHPEGSTEHYRVKQGCG